VVSISYLSPEPRRGSVRLRVRCRRQFNWIGVSATHSDDDRSSEVSASGQHDSVPFRHALLGQRHAAKAIGGQGVDSGLIEDDVRREIEHLRARLDRSLAELDKRRHELSVLARDLMKDRLVGFFNARYWLLASTGLVVPSALGALLTGSRVGALNGLLWAGFVRIFLVQSLYTGGLNSVCHAFGRKVFRSQDSSVNNAWLVFPTLGQSWHNNHHAFPNSARLDLLWYQIDPTGLALRLLVAVGLASRLNCPSRAAVQARRLVMSPAAAVPPIHSSRD